MSATVATNVVKLEVSQAEYTLLQRAFFLASSSPSLFRQNSSASSEVFIGMYLSISMGSESRALLQWISSSCKHNALFGYELKKKHITNELIEFQRTRPQLDYVHRNAVFFKKKLINCISADTPLSGSFTPQFAFLEM